MSTIIQGLADDSDTPGSTTIGAISPEFVGSTDKVVTAKTASVNATDSAVDIPWLQLTAIPGQGTLAKSVFRIDTVKGQPPKNVRDILRNVC